MTRSLALPENNKDYNGGEWVSIHRIPTGCSPTVSTAAGIQLATLDSDGIPRVRTVGFREILQPIGRPDLPVFVFASDVRMQKALQVRKHPFVELVWWFKGSSEQYRITGVARVVTAPDVDLGPPGETKVDTPAFDAFDRDGFDWWKKLRELYDDNDDERRASLIRPPPGSRIPSYDAAKEWIERVPKLGEGKDERDILHQEEGLRNYSLLLVEAFEVDWCELALKPHQRTKFRRTNDGWDEWPVVP